MLSEQKRFVTLKIKIKPGRYGKIINILSSTMKSTYFSVALTFASLRRLFMTEESTLIKYQTLNYMIEATRKSIRLEREK
jgi:hypothetical protein